jgi:hypothetical protein
MDQLFPKGTTDNKMILSFFRPLVLDKLQREEAMKRYDTYFKSYSMVMGSFFGGDRIAILDYYDFFWTTHEKWKENNEFVGIDQGFLTAYFASGRETWIQPNYLTFRCNPWWATWSFYGTTSLCFHDVPTLRNSSTYYI